MNSNFDQYLNPTGIIDSDHPLVQDYAKRITETCQDSVERSVKLYLAVRDGIRYDPYVPFHLPEHYRASTALQSGRSFCIPKASLLCALGRVCGIPSRIGFADVRNHLATKQLLDFLGNDIFSYHGFVEFYLQGQWVKATPAFNRELCERHQVPPLEFNGQEDSLFQAYNEQNRKFMEYVDYHGTYADIPVAEILAAWEKTYGRERVASWIKLYQEREGENLATFEQEEVWTG